jgi:hypothetical protein
LESFNVYGDDATNKSGGVRATPDTLLRRTMDDPIELAAPGGAA